MKTLTPRAQEIIDRILYVTIASTSKDGQPWNSPVFSAHDEHYNFYWGSHLGSLHSQNIKATGRVFLVIYDSTVEAGQGEGVYVQARCSEIIKATPERIWMNDDGQKDGQYIDVRKEVWS
jgi:hypothetical protein